MGGGAVRARPMPGAHVVTVAVEHSSVLETCRALEEEGCAVTRLPVNDEGRVSVAAVGNALRPETVLVSVALANNEIGTIQPVAEIGRLARERGVLVHTDAVQAAGKVPLDVEDLGVDLLSLSAHKIYGPKGTGALYVRTGVEIASLHRGGPQERERRAGTENVIGVVAFGWAAELARREVEEVSQRCRLLTRRLWEGMRDRISGVRRNGPRQGGLANTLNVSFDGVRGESLAVGLDLEGVAVSTGSACAAGAVEPSHVLLALGRTREEAAGAIRLSVGKDTTPGEIEAALDILAAVVERIRRVNAGGGGT